MLWLNPFALFALAAVVVPILIHLLIQRRAERFPFPTLQFLQPTRLAAIRRHLLEDLALLAVRVALLAAAVAALAGPLLVTESRRQAWDRRVVRAIVRDGVRDGVGEGVGAELAPPLREQNFAGPSLADGIRRAVLWLDTAPPARRELVVTSPFAIGSITAADIASIPAGVGVRLERTGTLPGTRTVPAGRLLTSGGVRAREVTLTRDGTSVRDTAAGDPMTWPIDVVSSKADQPAIDAAVAAVLSQHVWTAPPDRRARLVLLQPTGDADLKVRTTSDVVQAFRPAVIAQPWMADAVAQIARDPDLHAAGARIASGLTDARFAEAPWQILADAADGHPLAAAAAAPNRLIVASAAPASDVVTPLLLRAIANAIADVPDLQRAEVQPIADALLQQWSRPAAPLTSPRAGTVDSDDRRWLWFTVLCLMTIEMWIRRAKRDEAGRDAREETARVA